MEPKYKETPIGRIPEEWEVVRLGDEKYFEIISGGTPSTKNQEFWDNGYIFWATPTDITSLRNNTIKKTNNKITKKGLENSSAKLLPLGSVLMTSRATIGEVAINEVPMCTNQGFQSFISTDKVDNNFLLYSLKYSKNKIKRLGGQSTFSEVSKPLLKKFQIPLPPLPEQRRIAEVLGTVDSAIEKVGGAIERTERLKRGLMQRLLTRGIEHKRFKETVVGKVPEEWEVKAVGPSIDLLTGYPFKSKEFLDESSDLRLVRGINVTTGALRWGRELTKYWGDITDDLKKYQICENDLLIGMDGAKVGKNFAMVKVNDLPALLVQRVARIRTKNELDQRYLYYAIGSHLFVNYVGRVNTSSGIAHISEKQIKDFRIPFPPLPEQRCIAGILSTVDKKLELERSRKEKLERIKKGLMNDLLTGRKRIKI